mmetsp:Transcript_148713/g.386659  ORF Transcript_148713/g.386659 Transcript_148713/m.386659 type:complete len:219 (+) Transcript_148713:208-864(+)
MLPLPHSARRALSTAIPEQIQQVEEQVDDVQIQIHGGEHIFVNTEGDLVIPSKHQLSVVHDVEREKQDADEVVQHHRSTYRDAAHGQDRNDKAEAQKTQRGSDEVGATTCEVRFGGECVRRHPEKDEGGHTRGKCHRLPSVEGAGKSDQHSGTSREEGEERVVRWKFSEHVLATHHDTHGDKQHAHRRIQHPWMHHDKVLAPCSDRRSNGHGQKQLRG